MANGAEDKSSTAKWLVSCVKMLQEAGVLQPERQQPVVRFRHPSALRKEMDLELGSDPADEDHLLQLCREVIANSVVTGHPHFHNQLYGGTDPYGLVGSVITEALNTNQYTFEVAPVFTLCEHIIIRRILYRIGFNGGDGIFSPVEYEVINNVQRLCGFDSGDGIFSPGGSMSNMYAMVLARHHLNPDFKRKGLYCAGTIVAFTSEDAHYSITKGVSWLGIGTENLVKVKADRNGRMIPEELEKAIVYGAFDPIGQIADICEKYKIWLHVDACWGGALLFSKKHGKVLKDVHRADSFAWNPHKMLGAPLQCSAFFTKHKGLLHQCNSAAATYLFQQDKFYDVSYDTGDKSVQCGRKVDAFKLWLMWKARGDDGFERLVDQAMDCAQYLKERIAVRPGFMLVTTDTDCTNICFWYVPTWMRNQEKTQNWWQELGKIAPKIKEKMTYTGTLMIGYQPCTQRKLVNFFRFVTTCHPPRTFEDMDHVIREIETEGENIKVRGSNLPRRKPTSGWENPVLSLRPPTTHPPD
ncbi:UNVERIFIED_CONTAM: hypothetical protein PYX00_007139 [Menopon gallinae]|uniref:Cysteine sulfinic acid decarboxylase n=1 Tax=Menopon gallinae TaxID=328185 RepID=A0AAW2HHU4_9NEOP